MSHLNNGACQKCQDIMNKYAGFNSDLRAWFEKEQSENPEFHCSDAGRGHVDQETYFNRGASKAHYGESSHNYNCGIDTFWMPDGKYSLDLIHYKKLQIPEFIQWGHLWVSFPELPHFEIKDWKAMRAEGSISLVE